MIELGLGRCILCKSDEEYANHLICVPTLWIELYGQGFYRLPRREVSGSKGLY